MKNTKNATLKDQGCLITVSPAMLQYLTKLMDGINERVNRDRLKKHGKEMIQKALDNF